MKNSLARFLWIGFVVMALVGTQQSMADARSTEEQAAPANNLAADLSAVYNWSYAGAANGDKFGHAVHTAGDVNADGFADVIIGAPQYTHNVYKEGAAFVFYGGSYGLGSTPAWVAGSGQQGSSFGSAVSTAGDVNGDGYDDVIVGAEEYKVVFDLNGEPQSGAVFVYHGSEEGLSPTPDWTILAEAPEIRLGWAVSTAGDINGDGYDDVVVSAPHYESEASQTNEGKVYLYLGGADGLAAAPAWSYECNRGTALCGASLDAAGDVNGDDYDDVILGAPNCDALIEDEGCALVFFGSEAGFSLTANWVQDGSQEGALFGRSVAGAGDVNGDGYHDILVGAPGYTLDILVPQVGAAYLFYGSDTGPSHAHDWATYGEETYSRYGFSLHLAGDVNNDGYGDVLIGSYLLGTNGSEVHQPDEGGAYLFKGSASGLGSTTSWSAYGDKAEAWFGYSLGTAGDVDGDLADDILVGSPDYKFDEKTVMGKAFAFYSQEPGPQFTVFIPLIVMRSGE